MADLIVLAAEATPTDLLHYINTGGIVGLLVFIIIAGWRGWWVTKREHDELKARCNLVEQQNVKWMELAFKATTVSEQVSEIVKVK